MVIIATGPSVTQDDVDRVRRAQASDACRVMAIKESWQRAPWADVLYGCQRQCWDRIDGAKGFAGLKVCCMPDAAQQYPDVHWVEAEIVDNGLSLDPARIRTGQNSGFQCINLAVLFGASRILLLGFDFKSGQGGQQHWFPNSARKAITHHNYPAWLQAAQTLPPALARAGVTVLNCSPGSALSCFPRSTIAQTLP